MPAGTVGQNQQGVFSSPVNGQQGDAAVVLSNDNATRIKHNLHDADATIHVQSSVLASRPAAGTAGRFWVTSDGLRCFFDSGAAWLEVAYLPLAGGTVTGAVTITTGGLAVQSGGIAVTGLGTFSSSGITSAGAIVTTGAAGIAAAGALSAGTSLTTPSLTVGGGAAITKILSATFTWDIPSLTNGTFSNTTMTVTGAALGDVAIVEQSQQPFPYYGHVMKATVTGANTVEIVWHNLSGGTYDATIQTLRVIVFHI